MYIRYFSVALLLATLAIRKLSAIFWIRKTWSFIQRACDPVWRARVDPNRKCPACGNTDGKIQFVDGEQLKKFGVKDKTAMIAHVCSICNYAFLEDTLFKDTILVYDPAAQTKEQQ